MIQIKKTVLWYEKNLFKSKTKNNNKKKPMIYQLKKSID